MMITMMLTMIISPAMALRQQRGSPTKILWWSPRPAYDIDDDDDDIDDGDDENYDNANGDCGDHDNGDCDDGDGDSDSDGGADGDGDGLGEPYDQSAVPSAASATALTFQQFTWSFFLLHKMMIIITTFEMIDIIITIDEMIDIMIIVMIRFTDRNMF